MPQCWHNPSCRWRPGERGFVDLGANTSPQFLSSPCRLTPSQWRTTAASMFCGMHVANWRKHTFFKRVHFSWLIPFGVAWRRQVFVPSAVSNLSGAHCESAITHTTSSGNLDSILHGALCKVTAQTCVSLWTVRVVFGFSSQSWRGFKSAAASGTQASWGPCYKCLSAVDINPAHGP